jgi:VWFA-related protein
VEVPLVSVEVYVYHKDGRPVPGLQADDFEVFEDGRPVEISHFFAAPGVEGPDEKKDEEEADEAAGGYVPVERDPGQDLYLVILFNDTNLSRGRRQAAVEYLSGFLGRDLPANLKVMLVRYDGGMRVEQPFSEETDEVIAALEKIKDSASLSRRLDESRILLEIDRATTSTNATGTDSRRAPEYLGVSARSLLQEIDSFADWTVHQVRSNLEDQKKLIRSLSGLNGRKAILLVSDGVEQRPGQMLYRTWAQAFEDVPGFELEARRAVRRAATGRHRGARNRPGDE